MRFVVSLILASFSFVTTFGGNAEVTGKRPINNIENTYPSGVPDYSINDDSAPAIIQSNHRHSSITQHRSYPVIDFIHTIASQSSADFLYTGNHFVQPHLYCKRIGLRLIFPEHYFW